MFEMIRKHTKIMMAVLVLLIIPSFVLFGIDGYTNMRQQENPVARVGGQDITQSQWDAAHRNQVDRIRASSPNLDPAFLDSEVARYATLQQLVRQRVLAAAAEQGRLMTSDARLARFLQEDPGIAALRKADGKLDMDRYRQLAASQGLTPEGFENSVRQEISQQQVEGGVIASALTNPGVADVSLNAFFERRTIEVIRFKPEDFSGKVAPTEEDLNAYYKNNSAQFLAPEQAKIEYVTLDLEAVKKTIQISEADLKAYFDQNAQRLSGKEERRASHILINAAKSAPEGDRQKAKARAQAILKEVRAAPATFGAAAKKNSEDPGSATNGGDLDFFSRGAMVKPFEDAVFAMKKGDISEVVESDFGYHIIMLTDVKVPKQKSFEDLRASIESDLKSQQAQRKFAEVAEQFTNTVYEQSDSLKPVADKLKLEIRSADGVGRRPGPNSAGVLANEKFLTALFTPDALEKKHNTQAIETGANQLVSGRIVSYQAARTLDLKEVKEQVRARWIAKAAAELAKKEGAEKLAAWTQSAQSAPKVAEVIVSRDQPEKVELTIVSAALRADAQKLPAFLGVDLPGGAYAVVKVNKVLARDESKKDLAQSGRDQYRRLWSAAEAEAYYQLLRQQMKVEMLVPEPKSSGANALS